MKLVEAYEEVPSKQHTSFDLNELVDFANGWPPTFSQILYRGSKSDFTQFTVTLSTVYDSLRSHSEASSQSVIIGVLAYALKEGEKIDKLSVEPERNVYTKSYLLMCLICTGSNLIFSRSVCSQ